MAAEAFRLSQFEVGVAYRIGCKWLLPVLRWGALASRSLFGIDKASEISHPSIQGAHLPETLPWPPGRRTRNRRADVARIVLPVVAAFLAAGCGGSSADIAVVDDISAPGSASLHQFLYANSTATVEYWSDWGDVPSRFRALDARFAMLPVAEPGAKVGLFSVSYLTNNLPQMALHIRREGNTRLLVYNHGHGGLPAESERFAGDFLREALVSGHDLLITSMPLTGLNLPMPGAGVEYFMATRGAAAPARIAPEVLEHNLRHSLYEILDDRDHYLHYFVDGTVIPVSLLTGDAMISVYVANSTTIDGPRYQRWSYVGLSGGATVGLVACAMQSFHRCILVAGVMPDYLRLIDAKNIGDAEQHSRSFYERFPVHALLEMARASSGKFVMFLNRNDPCCFADPAASRFQGDFPEFDIRLTDFDYHGYRAVDLLGILAE